ncbi:MAG TPA: ATP-dependent DNA helicase [Candidatus Saccharimonadales bacterium]|nr:ATP-dependent DNA helicase [Candidatus Saccharimonadales bacterium]
MGKYDVALSKLNAEQRKAVETIDGPVLVIAGPGTGKTQLLTTRIAHILATTDTLPQNILCLTFTESAAQTMRERLSNFIGQQAYDVSISTYHAFGSDLIRRYPDYFAELADMDPVDDLGTDSIYRAIFEGLPYSNPLKFASVYLRDIQTFVSDAKRSLLSPGDLRAIADQNDSFITAASPIVAAKLRGLTRISKSSAGLFEAILSEVGESVDLGSATNGVVPLASLFMQELVQALQEVAESGKTTPLTQWKNAWLAKDSTGNFTVDGTKTNQKLRAAADIYQQYLDALQAQGLFDYDDMILRAVRALETNDDLRFTLQERYLYILLDEFQDTNGAQLRLVELLTDNPASEGRPNVLAVGDDDQAIYAFQGANYSHMLQFNNLYRDVEVITLTKNYRSHGAILHTAQGIAEQITERLHHNFPAITKTITAGNKNLPQTAIVERREAKSDVGQYAWTAEQIKKLIDAEVPPEEIAVLAPKHKFLEPLVPFLQELDIPVRYEKRENVLEDPSITQLVRMSELVLALNRGQHVVANALWAEVLSFDFWQLPTSLIWNLSWQANDDRENWTEVLLENESLKPIALFFIRLSMLAGTETLETMIDYLIGVTPLDLQEPDHASYKSPFYAHHFEDVVVPARAEQPEGQVSLEEAFAAETEQPSATISASFWNLLTNLTVLRSRLRDFRKEEGDQLHLADFISFVAAHQAANIKILNTSPYQEASEAVQLMTAYKSKGMEFQAVFVLAVSDDVWGSKARNLGSRLALPQNLQYIRYAGATNDERLRLFYVAITRAKTQLYLLNYTNTYGGRAQTRLKYLDETTNDDGSITSPHLPVGKQSVKRAEESNTSLTTELAAYWQQRHEAAVGSKDLRALLQGRLQQFQLSPTHVTAFVNLEHQGPAAFFMNTILRFPKAPIPTGEFGNAMHETLEWLHRYNKQHGHLPERALALETFGAHLRAKRLSEQDTTQFYDRGQLAIKAVLEQRAHTYHATDEAEFNFRNEGVFIGNAHMAGKIDKLIIDKQNHTITIVDYKTGKSYDRWRNDPKLHRYRLQLYLYKALVEESHAFAGYTVTDAYLEFVEPDEDGTVHELHMDFTPSEEADARKLAEAIWMRIKSLDIPDVSAYAADLAGVLEFEQFLREA